MPRLYHTKARTGCQRCKARKVKCDEGKPRCFACSKHDVVCAYSSTNAADLDEKIGLSSTGSSGGNHIAESASKDSVDVQLELRLMHLWATDTSQTFSPAVEFWRFQAPEIAISCRYGMEALLSLAALHASKRPPKEFISIDGRGRYQASFVSNVSSC